MLNSSRVQREARDAVIAARFRGGAEPVNPYNPRTRARLWWDMGQRRAEIAAAELLRVGAL